MLYGLNNRQAHYKIKDVRERYFDSIPKDLNLTDFLYTSLFIHQQSPSLCKHTKLQKP